MWVTPLATYHQAQCEMRRQNQKGKTPSRHPPIPLQAYRTGFWSSFWRLQSLLSSLCIYSPAHLPTIHHPSTHPLSLHLSIYCTPPFHPSIIHPYVQLSVPPHPYVSTPTHLNVPPSTYLFTYPPMHLLYRNLSHPFIIHSSLSVHLSMNI